MEEASSRMTFVQACGRWRSGPYPIRPFGPPSPAQRARADPAGEGLRRKLRLDIDGKTPPVGFAQGRADLGAKRAQEICAPRFACFERPGGVFELGELLGRGRGGEFAEAAQDQPEPPPAPVVAHVERHERRLNRIAHPFGGAARDVEKRRHLVERQPLGRGGEFAGEGEEGRGFGEAHGREVRPEMAQQGAKIDPCQQSLRCGTWE